MEVTPEKIKELLVNPGHISGEEYTAVLSQAKKTKRPLYDLLLENNLVKDEQFGQLLAEDQGFSFINLRKEKIDDTIMRTIPEMVSRTRGIVAFAREDSFVKLAMLDPEDLEMRNFIKKRFGSSVKVFFITKNDLRQALTRYRPSLKEEYEQIIKDLKNASGGDDTGDQLTIKLLDTLLEYGYFSKASDVHIEPYRSKVVIRFRIDGVMCRVLEIPKDFLEMILRRLKILAKMRTDEHLAAQDGKFSFKVDGDAIDVRVSVIPITGGENAVLRLLSSSSRKVDLDSLGLVGRDLEKVKKAINNPHGMVLVTGPTGSGKTTTIYEILKILNNDNIHIATIEDPVEYNIEGISQIQVNPKVNLTFAKGLRAIVRQDPDVIMVGEIRDSETADIAINSAMTGHLVLSTLHANDAATTLPRLLEMGVEAFLVASTVRIVIAQRLARKICEKCRYSYELEQDELNIVESSPVLKVALMNRGYKDLNKVMFFKGSGCKACAGTGYQGRLGVFEVLVVDDDIKNLIVKKAASEEIIATAKQNGMITMFLDGLNKVLTGSTTLSELLRVVEIN